MVVRRGLARRCWLAYLAWPRRVLRREGYLTAGFICEGGLTRIAGVGEVPVLEAWVSWHWILGLVGLPSLPQEGLFSPRLYWKHVVNVLSEDGV